MAEIKDKQEKNHKVAPFISGPLKARLPFLVHKSWDIVLEHALKPAPAPNTDKDADPSALRLFAKISKWEDLYAQRSSILIKLLLAKTSHSILPCQLGPSCRSKFQISNAPTWKPPLIVSAKMNRRQ
jgi:hypothetical protein